MKLWNVSQLVAEGKLTMTMLTDAFADELFYLPQAATGRFPLHRPIVDVERFPDGAQEPMRVGDGPL